MLLILSRGLSSISLSWRESNDRWFYERSIFGNLEHSIIRIIIGYSNVTFILINGKMNLGFSCWVNRPSKFQIYPYILSHIKMNLILFLRWWEHHYPNKIWKNHLYNLMNNYRKNSSLEKYLGRRFRETLCFLYLGYR